MARATMEGNRVHQAAQAAILVFSSEQHRDVLESLVSTSKLIEAEQDGQFWSGIALAVEEYNRNPLTKADLEKIKAYDAQIKVILAKIKKKNAEIGTKYGERIASAYGSGEFALAAELQTKLQLESREANSESQKMLESEQKLLFAVKNKPMSAALAKFEEFTGVHDGSSTESGGGGKYAYENLRFWVKATRVSPFDNEPLAYGCEMQVSTEDRRVFVKPLGDGYPDELRAGKYYFAGFYRDIDGKHAIKSRKRLCEMNYTFTSVATAEKPKNDAELREVFQKVMDRAELGNMDARYSGGSEYCLRIVEAYDSNAEDAGHQKLSAELPDPGWNDLEEHRAIVEAEISAEIAANDADDTETAESVENVAEKAA